MSKARISPTSWTEGFSSRISAVTSSTSRGASARSTASAAFLMPSPIGADDHLWVFTTGRADLSKRGWSDDEMARFAIAELEKVRPSTKGRL